MMTGGVLFTSHLAYILTHKEKGSYMVVFHVSTFILFVQYAVGYLLTEKKQYKELGGGLCIAQKF